MSGRAHIEITLKVQFEIVVALSANAVSWTNVVNEDTSSLYAAVVTRMEMALRLQSSSEIFFLAIYSYLK